MISRGYFEETIKSGHAEGWYVYKGIKGYASLYEVPGTDWVLGVKFTEKDVKSYVAEVTNSIELARSKYLMPIVPLVVAASLGVGVTVAVIISRKSEKPLKGLSLATEEVSKRLSDVARSVDKLAKSAERISAATEELASVA